MPYHKDDSEERRNGCDHSAIACFWVNITIPTNGAINMQDHACNSIRDSPHGCHGDQGEPNSISKVSQVTIMVRSLKNNEHIRKNKNSDPGN